MKGLHNLSEAPKIPSEAKMKLAAVNLLSALSKPQGALAAMESLTPVPTIPCSGANLFHPRHFWGCNSFLCSLDPEKLNEVIFWQRIMLKDVCLARFPPQNPHTFVLKQCWNVQDRNVRAWFTIFCMITPPLYSKSHQWVLLLENIYLFTYLFLWQSDRQMGKKWSSISWFTRQSPQWLHPG